VEGRNIEIEVRSAEGESERLPDLAAELVRLPVKVIVTGDGPGTRAAQQATGTIPIVMAAGGDPIEAGFIRSLARPGGNITGLSSMASRLVGKQLEFLKETVPGVSRVAVLWNNLSNRSALREVEASAAVLRVRLQPVEVRGPDELDGAFMTMTGEQADGLIVLQNAMLLAHRARVVSLAAESRLPAVYGLGDFVQAGGLMSYAANRSEMYRRSAYYVDRILKGTSPADLPVEQPMTFDFVVNLNTARELGITFPHEILLQVTEVIDQ
jgi:putative ABC transport system substrate-binding protein